METETAVEPVEAIGYITADLKGDYYQVCLEDNPEYPVIAKVCGKMRRHRIALQTGDCVRVELSPYDLSRGRIIWRN